jgi:hypothetical protein
MTSTMSRVGSRTAATTSVVRGLLQVAENRELGSLRVYNRHSRRGVDPDVQYFASHDRLPELPPLH